MANIVFEEETKVNLVNRIHKEEQISEIENKEQNIEEDKNLMGSKLKILDGRDTAFLCHPPSYTNANDKNELDLRDVNLDSDSSLHCGRLVPNALIQTIEYNSDAQNVKEDDQCNWIIL